MTREEIIDFCDMKSQFEPENEDIFNYIVKILEQESIIDKIKAEIEQSYCDVNNDYDHGRNYGLYMATQIIDKYKIENEE